jgi:hypothetical protein
MTLSWIRDNPHDASERRCVPFRNATGISLAVTTTLTTLFLGCGCVDGEKATRPVPERN